MKRVNSVIAQPPDGIRNNSLIDYQWWFYRLLTLSNTCVFDNGIAMQSEDVLSRARQINKLLSDWKLQVTSTASNTAADIVEYFAVNPYLTIKKVSEVLAIAYSTAQRGIEKLEKKGIIAQAGEAKRDKVYCAVKILSILEKPAKVHVNRES